MTLPLNSRLSALYDTNGTQKDFSFGFRVFFDPDNGGYGLEVRRQTADGYEIIPKSDYLVLPVEDNSAGIVRFSVAPSAGQQIYIAGKTPTIQQLVLTNFGRYSAESIETQFDFITAIIQEWLSALDEETRQRMAADEILTQYVVRRIDDFVQQINQNWDDKSQEIEDYIATIMPSFTQTLREEIEAYTVGGMQDAIDQTLAESKAEIDDAVARANAAALAAAIGGKVYDTPDAGVNPVTGVADGVYFNVRSSNDESYVDEYQNVGGVAVSTGKRYLSAYGVERQEKPASTIKDASGQSQQEINDRTVTPYDFGAFGDGFAHPLSERFSTLAAAQAVYPAATSLDEYIDGHALNAWYRDVCAKNRKYATCHGNFLSNIKISNADINSFNNTIKTKRIDFNATVTMTTISGIRENGWEIISPRQVEFSGYLELRDAGGLNYPDRRIDNLLYMEDFLHGKFTWKVVTRYARHLGLRAVSSTVLSINGTTANNNTSDLGAWQFNSCGHRFKHGDFTFNSVTDTGTSQASNQRSVLSFASNLPFATDALVDDFVNYKGKPYLIMANTANTISVYPWLHDSDTSGTVQVAWGGDFKLEGSDSNQIKMSSGASDCAVCAGKEGFYSGFKDQRVNEFNDIGCRVGGAVTGTQRRLTVAGLYFEGNIFDIVKTNLSSQDNTLFINPNGVDLSKCHVLIPLSTSREPAYALSYPFTVQNGNFGTYSKKNGQFAHGQTANTASQDLTIGDEHIKFRANSLAITLKDNADFRRVFGNVDLSCEVFGSGGAGVNNNYTTGNTTIKCESGFTINGASSDLVIPRSAPFWVSARLVSSTDWRVFIYYSEKPKASKNHDWASLAAGAQQSTTLQVFGANVGDSAVASMDVPLQGAALRAEVTDVNTVTVYHHNPTAAAVDVVSGTLTVKLI